MGTAVGRHPVGSGFAVLWRRTVRVDDPAFDAVLELDVDVDDGRLVVGRLEATRRPGGPPVTIDTLKSLPLVRLAAMGVMGDEGGPLRGLVRVRTSRVQPVARLDDLEELSEPERVAVIYRAAYFAGAAPTASVAEALGISIDMAAKRVQAARLAGQLEPTTKGRKGA